MQKKVLSLRLPCEFGAPLKEFAIKESTYSKWSPDGEVLVDGRTSGLLSKWKWKAACPLRQTDMSLSPGTVIYSFSDWAARLYKEPWFSYQYNRVIATSGSC